jgi:hypothetical protein
MQKRKGTPSPALSPTQIAVAVLQEPPVGEAASAVDVGNGDGEDVEFIAAETDAVGLITAILSVDKTVEVGRDELCDIVVFCVMLNGTVAKWFKYAAPSVSLYKTRLNPYISCKVVVTVQL